MSRRYCAFGHFIHLTYVIMFDMIKIPENMNLTLAARFLFRPVTIKKAHVNGQIYQRRHALSVPDRTTAPSSRCRDPIQRVRTVFRNGSVLLCTRRVASMIGYTESDTRRALAELQHLGEVRLDGECWTNIGIKKPKELQLAVATA